LEDVTRFELKFEFKSNKTGIVQHKMFQGLESVEKLDGQSFFTHRLFIRNYGFQMFLSCIMVNRLGGYFEANPLGHDKMQIDLYLPFTMAGGETKPIENIGQMPVKGRREVRGDEIVFHNERKRESMKETISKKNGLNTQLEANQSPKSQTQIIPIQEESKQEEVKSPDSKGKQQFNIEEEFQFELDSIRK